MLTVYIKCRFIINFIYNAYIIRLGYNQLFAKRFKTKIVIISKMKLISAKSYSKNSSVIYLIININKRFIISHVLGTCKSAKNNNLKLKLIDTVYKRFRTQTKIRRHHKNCLGMFITSKNYFIILARFPWRLIMTIVHCNFEIALFKKQDRAYREANRMGRLTKCSVTGHSYDSHIRKALFKNVQISLYRHRITVLLYNLKESFISVLVLGKLTDFIDHLIQ